MKITHIGSVLMGHPHPWVFVKVHTDAGIVGIGEAYNGAGVHQVIADERFQSMLIGDNLRNVAQLFHRMMRWKASYAGVIMKAISGVESALWDALIHELPLIENGHIRVPDRPGLGVTLNEDVVRQHMKEELEFFTD